MKISFTKEEFKNLLDLLHTSSWVLFSHNNQITNKKEKYFTLEQKLLRVAKDFGYENSVDYDLKKDIYTYSEYFEENTPVKKIIQEFEDETFWDELTTRLTRRDLVGKHGLDTIKNMELTERINEESEIGKTYYYEFINNGLSNLVLKKNIKKTSSKKKMKELDK